MLREHEDNRPSARHGRVMLAISRDRRELSPRPPFAFHFGSSIAKDLEPRSPNEIGVVDERGK